MAGYTESRESKSSENVINLDRILKEEVGEWGLYQLRLVVICAVLAFTRGLVASNYIFLFAKLNTRCLIPECESFSTELNFTPAWISQAVPAVQGSFDNCHRYANTSVNVSDVCYSQLFDRESVLPCEKYVYESKNSAYYEFNLACDDWRPNLIGSVKSIGSIISLPMIGFVADRWGRRLALTLALLNSGWISCVKYWISSYNTYAILEFFENIIGGASFSCIFILAVEYVGSKHRAAAGAAMTSFGAIGYTLQGIVAWTGIYWRYLIFIFNVPSLLCILCLWIAPESVRWLMSKGRYKKSKTILENAAKMNGNSLSQKTINDFSEGLKLDDENKSKSDTWLICLVFTHKRVLFHCMLTPIWWISHTFVFYGLSLSAVTISGNMYLNYIAVFAIEIPGHFLAFLLLNRIGRKLLITSGFWICGACQIIYMLMPGGHYWLSLCIYLAGKLSITVVVTSVYVFTAELFPTQYRMTFLTYSSMIGRLGLIVAPLTPAMSSAIWEPLPFVLFAGMAFLSGLLVLLAPETFGAALPDTMQEANDLGKDSHSSFLKLLRTFLFRKKSYTLP